MTDDIRKRLLQEVYDEQIEQLLVDTNELLKMSRKAMQENYSRWDANRKVYLGEKPLTKEDQEAAEQGEPEKFVVPMTYAQANTFIAFAFMQMMQGARFFRLGPTGSEDNKYQLDCETVLERDLRRNQWSLKLYQVLLDVCICNLGVTKESWESEMIQFSLPTESEGLSFDFTSDGKQLRQLVGFKGNRIVNVSPWQFFPDTRRPLAEWQRGQFAADECSVGKQQLKEWEYKGVIAGSEYVTDLTARGIEERGGRAPESIRAGMRGPRSELKDVIRTEVQIDLVPSKYGIGFEEYPVRYLLWIVNDTRIVRIERMGYVHRQFTYNVHQTSPDIHSRIGLGLCDVIFPLQEVITWLINSRIYSVRRAIDGKIVVESNYVHVEDFEGLGPVIRTRKGAPSGLGVDKFVKQLEYRDTTAAHMNDSGVLKDWVMLVTGVNENAMGNYTGGRRSATEARAATSGAGSRMKLGTKLVWDGGIAPMGQKMLLNSRQGLDLETFGKIVGIGGPSLTERFALFRPADAMQLVGSEDFFVLDGTVESEKVFIAQSLQEILVPLLTNPLNAQMLDLNPRAILDEIMELRGAGRMERFNLSNAIAAGQARPISPPVNGGAGSPPPGAGEVPGEGQGGGAGQSNNQGV